MNCKVETLKALKVRCNAQCSQEMTLALCLSLLKLQRECTDRSLNLTRPHNCGFFFLYFLFKTSLRKSQLSGESGHQRSASTRNLIVSRGFRIATGGEMGFGSWGRRQGVWNCRETSPMCIHNLNHQTQKISAE